ADLRLTGMGRELGLIDDERWRIFASKREAIAMERERLKSTWLNPRLLSEDTMQGLFGQKLERDYTLEELLRRPGVHYQDLISLAGANPGLSDDKAAEQVEIQVKYQGYVERQQDEVSRQEQFETTRMPAELDYGSVRGLSIEVQQKLNKQRPETLGQAARISGITPAAISLLLVHLKRGFGRAASERESPRPRKAGSDH
ncbi:MAG: tRNA uridine-5-carboxymethylaminomethyl(34) synthesis enzyme MnmG, partial [Betaproteobacteria bacterium]